MKNSDEITVFQWKQEHGHWGDEHPDHPMADWRLEVANDDTRLGYWEWAKQRDNQE